MACQAIQSHCSAGAKVLGTEFLVEQKGGGIARSSAFFVWADQGKWMGNLSSHLNRKLVLCDVGVEFEDQVLEKRLTDQSSHSHIAM